ACTRAYVSRCCRRHGWARSLRRVPAPSRRRGSSGCRAGGRRRSACRRASRVGNSRGRATSRARQACGSFLTGGGSVPGRKCGRDGEPSRMARRVLPVGLVVAAAAADGAGVHGFAFYLLLAAVPAAAVAALDAFGELLDDAGSRLHALLWAVVLALM